MCCVDVLLLFWDVWVFGRWVWWCVYWFCDVRELCVGYWDFCWCDWYVLGWVLDVEEFLDFWVVGGWGDVIDWLFWVSDCVVWIWRWDGVVSIGVFCLVWVCFSSCLVWWVDWYFVVCVVLVLCDWWIVRWVCVGLWCFVFFGKDGCDECVFLLLVFVVVWLVEWWWDFFWWFCVLYGLLWCVIFVIWRVLVMIWYWKRFWVGWWVFVVFYCWLVVVWFVLL